MLIPQVHAKEVFSVTPAIIDADGKQRDVIEKTISLTNHTSRKLSIYASVLNVAKDDGGESFETSATADKTTSLANWIKIRRGVIELEPKETKDVPLKIEINLRAKEGEYHAKVRFREGSTRGDAEGNQEVLINTEVKEVRKENLILKSFRPENSLFWKLPIAFTYEVQNVGNQNLRPGGSILLYGKKGEEIGELRLNEEEEIKPGDTYRGRYEWEDGRLLGNIKAILSLSYGEGSPKTIQDTVFFRVIPWQAGALALLGGTVVVFWKRKRRKYKTHRQSMKLRKAQKTQIKHKAQRPKTQSANTRKVVDIHHPR